MNDFKIGTAPAIRIENLLLSYRKKPLFENFHLTIAAGQWTCLLGPSGIGKTTLLRIVAGLPIETEENAFSVSLHIDNRDPASFPIAYMAQNDMLLPWLTVLENVLIEYRLRTQSYHKKDKLHEALTLLAQVGLSHVAHVYPHQLSTGMRQRAALVRTLIGDHSIVLMDEPFSALDTITRFHLQNLAAQLLTGRTILLVTHDPLEAIRLADTIHVLSNAPAKLLSTVSIEDPRPRPLSDPKWLTIQTQLFSMLTQAHEEFYANQ